MPNRPMRLTRGFGFLAALSLSLSALANEEAPFAKLRQIHLRIGDGEPVELAPHPFMVIQAKGDVIDRLAGPVDRAALARN